MIITPEMKDLLEALSYLSTIFGIPIAFLVYLAQKRKDRLETEAQSYIQANARYVEYLRLCIQHPELDCADFIENDPDVKSTGLSVKKLTVLTILVSLLESGYVHFRHHRRGIKQTQWHGWHEYMAMWSQRPDFQKAWPVIGPWFDSEFVEYMEEIFRSNKSA